MRRLLSIIAVLLFVVACEKEVAFSCRVIECDATNISTSGVTLEATVHASHYEAIDQMGFLVAVKGQDKYELYTADKGRLIEATIDDLKPGKSYEYRILVRAAGDSWSLEGGQFKTLKESDSSDDNNDDNNSDDENNDDENNDNGGDDDQGSDDNGGNNDDETGDDNGDNGGDEGDDDDNDNTDPTPSEGYTYRLNWYELPVEVDVNKDGRDDNNSDYYYAHHLCAGGEKNAQRNGSARNYTVCFSANHHCPVWVAAPRHSCYESGASRTDAYSQDPQIPSDIQYKSKSTGGGCNKGHMLGSAERLSSTATNKQVFYYSNIAPQYSSTFNTGGGAWNNLEDHIDGLVCADTLYTVIGCYFDTYTDKYGNIGRPARIDFGGRSDVSRPTMFYYALLRTKKGNSGKCVKDCSASELQCVAFVICHEQEKGHKPQVKDMISIEELEKLTGFTYFQNVPNAPKSTFNSSDWL